MVNHYDVKLHLTVAGTLWGLHPRTQRVHQPCEVHLAPTGILGVLDRTNAPTECYGAFYNAYIPTW